MTQSEFVLWPMTAALAVVCALLDWRRRRVPVVLPLGGLGLLLAVRLALDGVGGLEAGLISGVLGLAGCAGPFALLALSSRVGWGDVALLAGVGAGLGMPRALTALMLISVVGAAAAVWFMLGRRRASASVDPMAPEVRAVVDSARAIPYGVPIAVGALWAMAWAGPAVPDGSGDAPVQIEVVDGGVVLDE